MTACGPLCTPITGGAESLSLPADRGRIWGAVPPLRRSAYPRYLPLSNRFTRDEKKSRINAGVSGGASGWSHLPALRPQARFGGQPPAVRAALRPEMCGQLREFWVYQKWGQKQAAGITFVVTIPELLLP